MISETFHVSNMKCQGCVKTVKEGLGALDGVSEVQVELAVGLVTVHGTSLSRSDLEAKLAQLGYPAQD